MLKSPFSDANWQRPGPPVAVAQALGTDPMQAYAVSMGAIRQALAPAQLAAALA